MNSLCFLVLCLVSVSANWTVPSAFMSLGTDIDFVSSVYYDPGSGIVHAVLTHAPGYTYLAVSPSGTLLYNTSFSTTSCGGAPVIRGTGDGKKLFLAFDVSKGYRKATILFTESADSGKTWDTPKQLFTGDDRLFVQEMLLIKEAKRIFLFFTNNDNELRMVSRDLAGGKFSGECLVAEDVLRISYGAQATYSFWLTKLMIHVAYVSKEYSLKYTRSIDNGVKWITPKEIVGEQDIVFEVMSMVGASWSGPEIYVTYTTRDIGQKMIFSKNYGNSFSPPISISKPKRTGSYPNGMALRGTSRKNALVVLSGNSDFKADYMIWNTSSEVQPEFRENPFNALGGRVHSTNLACDLERSTSLVKVFGFAVVELQEKPILYFAMDSFYLSSPPPPTNNSSQCE